MNSNQFDDRGEGLMKIIAKVVNENL